MTDNTQRIDVELLTSAETARILKVKDQTLAVWRLRGYGPPFIRVGRGWVRYRRVQLLEWLTQFEIAQ